MSVVLFFFAVFTPLTLRGHEALMNWVALCLALAAFVAAFVCFAIFIYVSDKWIQRAIKVNERKELPKLKFWRNYFPPYDDASIGLPE